MLSIQNLHVFYGQSHILQGVSLTVAQGETLALLGRNGVGRSTLARAIMGLVGASGTITWRGQPLLGQKTFEIARLGVGYVPESRDIFGGLTVDQNLMLGQKKSHASITSHAPYWTMDDAYAMFPLLKDRRRSDATTLSGGEQKILALCRTLMGSPSLLILDEPTEGLSPQMVKHIEQCLQQLKTHGITVLLIEQKQTRTLGLSDRCAVMAYGRIVFAGAWGDLHHRPDIGYEW